jgi:hypothetical protein
LTDVTGRIVRAAPLTDMARRIVRAFSRERLAGRNKAQRRGGCRDEHMTFRHRLLLGWMHRQRIRRAGYSAL